MEIILLYFNGNPSCGCYMAQKTINIPFTPFPGLEIRLPKVIGEGSQLITLLGFQWSIINNQLTVSITTQDYEEKFHEFVKDFGFTGLDLNQKCFSN